MKQTKAATQHDTDNMKINVLVLCVSHLISAEKADSSIWMDINMTSNDDSLKWISSDNSMR